MKKDEIGKFVFIFLTFASSILGIHIFTNLNLSHVKQWFPAVAPTSSISLKFFVLMLAGMLVISALGGFYLKSNSKNPPDKLRLIKFLGILVLILLSAGSPLIWTAGLLVMCFMALGRSWDMLRNGFSKWHGKKEGDAPKKFTGAWMMGWGAALLIVTSASGAAAYYFNVYNICAATRDKNIEMVKLNLTEGGDISVCGHHKRTPLHLAVIKKNISLVKILTVEKYLNAKDIRGETSLDWAIEGENVEIISFLKEAGAQPGDQPETNKTEKP